ncbi:MAG TPA: hypothetical protein VH092_20135 [Urbifossiella sp.]|jgi:hypothetical protein|nr:hypothetical protein [Urbifossiella sp.]
MRCAVLAVVLFVPAARADEPPARLSVVASKALPPFESVSVYRAGIIKPRAAQPKPVLTVTTFGEPVALPDGGPFHVYARPKGGSEVLVARDLKAEPGKTLVLKLVERLGTIDVFRRDDSPRVGRIVVTDPFDVGPDEKGHVAVQTAPDFRVEMVVPEGDYAVWVVPENGARAVRVADRIRVLSGRIVRVE